MTKFKESKDGSAQPGGPGTIENLTTSFLATIATLLYTVKFLLEADDKITPQQRLSSASSRQNNDSNSSRENTTSSPQKSTVSSASKINGSDELANSQTPSLEVLTSPVLSDRRRTMLAEEDEECDRYREMDYGVIRPKRSRRRMTQNQSVNNNDVNHKAGSPCHTVIKHGGSTGVVGRDQTGESLLCQSSRGCDGYNTAVAAESTRFVDIHGCTNNTDSQVSPLSRDRPTFASSPDQQPSFHNRHGDVLNDSHDIKMDYSKGKPSEGDSTSTKIDISERIQACSRRVQAYNTSSSLQQKYSKGINKALYQLSTFDDLDLMENEEDDDLDELFKFRDDDDNRGFEASSGQVNQPSCYDSSTRQYSFYSFHSNMDDMYSTEDDCDLDGQYRHNNAVVKTAVVDNEDRSPIIRGDQVNTIAKIGSIEDLLSHEMSFDCDDEMDNFSNESDNSSSNSSATQEVEIHEFYDRRLDTITEEDSDDIENCPDAHVPASGIPWWKLDKIEPDLYDSSSDDDPTPVVGSPDGATTSPDNTFSCSSPKRAKLSEFLVAEIPRWEDIVTSRSKSENSEQDKTFENKNNTEASVPADKNKSRDEDNLHSFAKEDSANSGTADNDDDEGMNSIKARASFFEVNLSKKTKPQAEHDIVIAGDDTNNTAPDGAISHNLDQGQTWKKGPDANELNKLTQNVTSTPKQDNATFNVIHGQEPEVTSDPKSPEPRNLTDKVGTINYERGEDVSAGNQSLAGYRDPRERSYYYSATDSFKEGATPRDTSVVVGNARTADVIDLKQGEERSPGSASSPVTGNNNHTGSVDGRFTTAVTATKQNIESDINTFTSSNDVGFATAAGGSRYVSVGRRPGSAPDRDAKLGSRGGDSVDACGDNVGQTRGPDGGPYRPQDNNKTVPLFTDSRDSSQTDKHQQKPANLSSTAAVGSSITYKYDTAQQDVTLANATSSGQKQAVDSKRDTFNNNQQPFVFNVPKKQKSYSFTLLKDRFEKGPGDNKSATPVNASSGTRLTNEKLSKGPISTSASTNNNASGLINENIIPKGTDPINDAYRYKPELITSRFSRTNNVNIDSEVGHRKPVLDYDQKTPVTREHKPNYGLIGFKSGAMDGVTASSGAVPRPSQPPPPPPSQQQRYVTQQPQQDHSHSASDHSSKSNTPGSSPQHQGSKQQSPPSKSDYPDTLWGNTSPSRKIQKTPENVDLDVYEPEKVCTAQATSTALARRDLPIIGAHSEDRQKASAVTSAVARAEATAENPYIAVARASARAASVATASAANALTAPGEDAADDPDENDIRVVISTSCTLRGKDNDLHNESGDILDSLDDYTQANIHSLDPSKAGSGVHRTRMKALTDAATQSTIDLTTSSTTSSPGSKRKLKITIEHPGKPDGSKKEVRRLECDLPITTDGANITSLISDTVRQILQTNSSLLPEAFLEPENLDNTVEKVTEQVINAYVNKDAASDLESVSSTWTSSHDDNASLGSTSERTKTKSKSRVKKSTTKKVKKRKKDAPEEGLVSTPNDAVVFVPLDEQDNGMSSYKGEILSSSQVNDTAIDPSNSLNETDSHMDTVNTCSTVCLNNEDIPSELGDQAPIKKTKVKRPKEKKEKKKKAKVKKPKEQNLTFHKAETLVYDNEEDLISDVINTDKHSAIPLSDTVVFVKEKKAKKKKGGKLKGILKNSTKDDVAHYTEQVSVDQVSLSVSGEDHTLDLNGFKYQASAVPTSNIISPICDSALISGERTTWSGEGSSGKHGQDTTTTASSTDPKSILAKDDLARSDQTLVLDQQRFLRQARLRCSNKEKEPYHSVLQDPVQDTVTPVGELEKYRLPDKDLPVNRRKIENSRSQYLQTKDATQDNNKHDDSSKTSQAASNKGLVVVDINYDRKPGPDIQDLKQKVLSVRLKPPPAPFPDSAWNAKKVIASWSHEGGLDDIGKNNSFAGYDLDNNDQSVRKTKSLGTLPNNLLHTVDQKSQSSETILESDKMTPGYYETDLDNVDSDQRSKSMMNIPADKSRNHRGDNYLDKHQSMVTLPSQLKDCQYDQQMDYGNPGNNLSENELRVARSLGRLSVPDWYSTSPRKDQEIVILQHAHPKNVDVVEEQGSRRPWKITKDATDGGLSPKPVIIQNAFSYRPSFRGRSPVMQDPEPRGQENQHFELPSAKLRSKSQERMPTFPVQPFSVSKLRESPPLERLRPAKDSYIKIRERSKSRERTWLQPHEIEDENLQSKSSTSRNNSSLDKRASRSRAPFAETSNKDYLAPESQLRVTVPAENVTAGSKGSWHSPIDSGLGSSFASDPLSPQEVYREQQQQLPPRHSHQDQYQPQVQQQGPSQYQSHVYENVHFPSNIQHSSSNEPNQSHYDTSSIQQKPVIQQVKSTLVANRREVPMPGNAEINPSHKERKVKSKSKHSKKTKSRSSSVGSVESDVHYTGSKFDQVDNSDPTRLQAHPKKERKKSKSPLNQGDVVSSVKLTDSFVSYEESPGAKRMSRKDTFQQRPVESVPPPDEDPVRGPSTKVKAKKKKSAVPRTQQDQKGSFENLLDGLLVLDDPSMKLMNRTEEAAPQVTEAEAPLSPLHRALGVLKSPGSFESYFQSRDSSMDSFSKSFQDSPLLEIKPNHSDEADVFVKCRNTKCGKEANLASARKSYKTCHNCYTYYCSRDCRKSHWEKHKKKCHFSRVNSMCKHITKKVHDDEEICQEITRVARGGYLSRGRGCVLMVFSSSLSADLFLQHGLAACDVPPAFAAISDFQDFEAMGEHVFELTDMCKTYNPEMKFVLEVAVVATDGDSSQAPTRRESSVIKKCTKLRLSSDLRNFQQSGDSADQDTLILTAVPGSELTENMEERKAREIWFVNSQRKLRQRGVSLRHQYPDVYKQLCAYVADNVHFTPITLFPLDKNTGRKFMCLIMPDSEPDVEWSNRTDVLDQLGLSTAV